MPKQKTLLQNKPFWGICIAGVLTAIITAVLINLSMLNSPNYTTCEAFFLPHCLANLFDNMKAPLAILTATITVAGFWALLFRSAQTAKQIEVTIENNIYTNYITHKKEFSSLLRSIEENTGNKFDDKKALYKSIFPSNNKSSFTPIGDAKFITMLIRLHNSSFTKLDECIKAHLKISHVISKYRNLQLGATFRRNSEQNEIFNKINRLKEANKGDLDSFSLLAEDFKLKINLLLHELTYNQGIPFGIELNATNSDNNINEFNEKISERYQIIQEIILFSETLISEKVDLIKIHPITDNEAIKAMNIEFFKK